MSITDISGVEEVPSDPGSPTGYEGAENAITLFERVDLIWNKLFWVEARGTGKTVDQCIAAIRKTTQEWQARGNVSLGDGLYPLTTIAEEIETPAFRRYLMAKLGAL